MAIAPTGAIYKALSFDNVSSRGYGVYITGEAVYDAPERAIEMVSIPGRNGAVALDMGRFENIEVTYPAGIFADNETQFATAISNFRNLLCSKRGYRRLADEYHPNEYRMAIYKSGLEVDPAQLRAGEFNITFECKPQRFLLSGETAVTVANNESVNNPTLFPANPLLAVKGYGAISFNGFRINLDAGAMGYTEIENPFSFSIPLSKQLTSSQFNATDDIQTGRISVRWGLNAVGNYAGFRGITLGGSSAPADTGDGTTSIETIFDRAKTSARVVTSFPTHLFSGSSTTTMTDTAVCRFQGELVNPSDTFYPTFTATANITVRYTPSTKTLSVQVSGSVSGDSGGNTSFTADTSHCNGVYAYSTVNVLGDPTYIDCELGEAYKVENGSYISLNSHIDLGSELPNFHPSTNRITMSNTITELQVTPRWWKV